MTTKYELAVFANNTFNQAYTAYGASIAGFGNEGNWGNPRIVGVEAAAKF